MYKKAQGLLTLLGCYDYRIDKKMYLTNNVYLFIYFDKGEKTQFDRHRPTITPLVFSLVNVYKKIFIFFLNILFNYIKVSSESPV